MTIRAQLRARMAILNPKPPATRTSHSGFATSRGYSMGVLAEKLTQRERN